MTKNGPNVGTKAYKEYAMNQNELQKQLLDLINEHSTELQTLVELSEVCDDNMTMAAIRGLVKQQKDQDKKVKQLQNRIDKLKIKMDLVLGTGPFCLELESMLIKHKIERQKYHSRSFVGNDCNKYTKTEVYTDICDIIVVKAVSLNAPPHILLKAKSLSRKYKVLMSKFSEIHKQISHSHFLSDRDIQRVQMSITSYCDYFREKFPAVRFTPKMHLLEDHAVKNLMRFRYGMSLFGEQGKMKIYQHDFS